MPLINILVMQHDESALAEVIQICLLMLSTLKRHMVCYPRRLSVSPLNGKAAPHALSSTDCLRLLCPCARDIRAYHVPRLV